MDDPEDDKNWLEGGLDVNDPEDNETWLEGGLDVDNPEDDENWLEGGLDGGDPGDDEAWLERGLDGSDVSEDENVDIVEKVGDAVCPWQPPLLIETSSIAKSPVNEDPAIPSNVTWIDK